MEPTPHIDTGLTKFLINLHFHASRGIKFTSKI
nr:MAG TPA: hypothetical protein [Caudoviricetes sp.]DAO56781.1 MAG TPA: hypothetical protein [Bacteriophage sp.]DAK40603.1 MAG TPA: hypothetical protein [Caudoviricetes sp.]DAM36299.1 MAG TPA: hypothetical protein [Caudoviricetes sp.]DAO14306.1 MAG TPA: hypothetical protein [Caudoviricetes sp.]